MDDNGQPRPPILLNHNHVLGIIQRLAMELHQYCNQMPENIDPRHCMGYVEEMGSFVQRLVAHMPTNAGKPEGIHGKAN